MSLFFGTVAYGQGSRLDRALDSYETICDRCILLRERSLRGEQIAPEDLKNIFKEWGPEWKLQVLENRKEFVVTLPLDKSRSQHVITLSIIDPGQIVQKITCQATR